MEGDDVFSLENLRKKVRSGPRPPVRDEKLYEL